MPWQERSPMDEREQFVREALSGLYTMTELCARATISRKTGYKWLERYHAGGRPALGDQSRAPHHCPHRVSADLVALLCAARQKHTTWGPRTLLAWLAPRHPEIPKTAWPAVSTAGDVLQRAGLVQRRRRRRDRAPQASTRPPGATAPNDIWTADFKGEFRTRDGVYCYPLTIADLQSRYLLACHGMLAPRGPGVAARFTQLFRTHGLPQAIRTDNGPPFGTIGLHGLSALSVWWLRLGIVHHRGRPSHPQDNGAHERMHRTLKQCTTRPPQLTLGTQQRAFDRFRHEFNTERPHQALGDQPPAVHYAPSSRPLPARLPPLEYPGHYLVRRVTEAGSFRFRGQWLFLTKVLHHQPIGLEETGDGIWSIHFASKLLARFDERDNVLHP